MAIIIPRPVYTSDLDNELTAARAIELRVQRDLTHAFIMSDPVSIVLTPKTKTVTATGGRTKVAGTPRAAQLFRIIENEAGGRYNPIQTTDGIERKYSFELLGEYDAVVAVGDTFTYENRSWEIVEMMPDLDYEVRASVMAHG